MSGADGSPGVRATVRRNPVIGILHGYGGVGNDHPIGPSMCYHPACSGQRSCDMDGLKIGERSWFS